jgi:lysophospholipase L1-like esterase
LGYNDQETFKKHIDQLDKLFKDIQAMGAQPIFVLMPCPSMWTMFSKHTRNDIYGRIKNVVSYAGVPIIDLSYIEEKDTIAEFQVYRLDPHPNAKMHAEFANAIYNFLMKDPQYVHLLRK